MQDSPIISHNFSNLGFFIVHIDDITVVFIAPVAGVAVETTVGGTNCCADK